MCACLLSALPAQSVRDLSGYLPADTLVVLDFYDGEAVIEGVAGLVEPLPTGIGPQLRATLLLPLLTRFATGMSIDELLETVFPSQAALALLPGDRPYPVLLSRIEEPDSVRRLLGRLPGTVAWSLDDGILSVSDSAEHLGALLSFRASGRGSLLSDRGYRRDRAEARPGKSVRFYVNLAALRPGPIWPGFDPAARVLFGPLVRSIDRADRIDGRFDIEGDVLLLSGRLDGDLASDPLEPDRLYAVGRATRSVPGMPEGAVACVSLDRDLTEVFEHPDRWLNEDGTREVQTFLSVASLILGAGKEFDADLLGGLDLPITLFVARTEPSEYAERPRVVLPAFTLVCPVVESSRRFENMLNRALGFLVAVANPERIENKEAPLVVRGGSRDGYRFQSVLYGDWEGPGEPPTEFGLSPSLLFAHDHLILSSTVEGAVEMARSLEKAEVRQVTGDFLKISGAVAADLIDANRRVLSVSRVLDEGERLAEAEFFIDTVAAVLRVLELEAVVAPDSGGMEFRFELRRVRR